MLRKAFFNFSLQKALATTNWNKWWKSPR